MEGLGRLGGIKQVARIEAIAGELDGHIKALSSVIDRLMVRQRVRVKV